MTRHDPSDPMALIKRSAAYAYATGLRDGDNSISIDEALERGWEYAERMASEAEEHL